MVADLEKLDATFKISASIAVVVLAISSLSIIALVIARKIHKKKTAKMTKQTEKKGYRKTDTTLVSVNGNPYDTTVHHVIGDKWLMGELDLAVAKARLGFKSSAKENPQTASSNPPSSSNTV